MAATTRSKHDLAAFATDPDWLLAAIHGERREYHFARVSPETYRDSPFLDRRIRPRPGRYAAVPIAELNEWLEACPDDTKPAGYIFHTAFCCSTLLATCLQQLEQVLVLKEPTALAAAATARRIMLPTHGAADDAWRVTIDPILRLLEKRYDHTPHVVIKPTNYCNNLVADVLDGSDRRAVYLHGTLEDFLCSILKKPAASMRSFLDQQLAGFARDSTYLRQATDAGFAPTNLLQQATLLWTFQMDWMGRISRGRSKRLLHLAADELLANPEAALARVIGHLRLGEPDALAQSILAQGALAVDPKLDQTFDPARRRQASRQVLDENRQAVDETLDWWSRLQRALPVTGLAQ